MSEPDGATGEPAPSGEPAVESVEARVAVDDRVVLDCGSFALEGPRVLLAGDAGAFVAALSGVPASALVAPEPGGLLLTEGVARVASGRLSVRGRDVALGDHKASLGVALAGAPLPANVTPLAWMRTAAELAGLPGRAAARLADAWAARLGVPTGKRDRLGVLSTFERRLTALAAAVVADPEVLLVEEPFEGLDPPGASALLGALATAAEGRLALVSARRLLPGGPAWSLALGASDVVLFDGGRVELAARAAEVVGTGTAFSLIVLDGALALRAELTRAGLRVSGAAERPTVVGPPGTRVADVLGCVERAGAAVARVRPLL